MSLLKQALNHAASVTPIDAFEEKAKATRKKLITEIADFSGEVVKVTKAAKFDTSTEDGTQETLTASDDVVLNVTRQGDEKLVATVRLSKEANKILVDNVDDDVDTLIGRKKFSYDEYADLTETLAKVMVADLTKVERQAWIRTKAPHGGAAPAAPGE